MDITTRSYTNPAATRGSYTQPRAQLAVSSGEVFRHAVLGALEGAVILGGSAFLGNSMGYGGAALGAGGTAVYCAVEPPAFRGHRPLVSNLISNTLVAGLCGLAGAAFGGTGVLVASVLGVGMGAISGVSRALQNANHQG